MSYLKPSQLILTSCFLFALLAAMLPETAWCKEAASEKPSAQPPTEAQIVLQRLDLIKIDSLRDCLEDMSQTWPDRFTKSVALRNFDGLEKRILSTRRALQAGDKTALLEARAIIALTRSWLLQNPLLDFKRMLVVKRHIGKTARSAMGKDVGHPGLNSQTLTTANTKLDSEISLLSNLRKNATIKTLYRPEKPTIVTDVDLHFDAERMMFSSIGTFGKWHLFELNIDGTGLTQITPKDLPDVDHFDACYLPNEDIIFTSTAAYQGLPCQYGNGRMAPMYRLFRKTGRIEQLTFEQDSDWNPTLLPDGGLMYLRWEYTDTPHFFTRILMRMNPDGTNQRSIYGSNSYFPNAFFFPKPIPGTNQIVGIASGHHGVSRSGRMLVIDPSVGQFEADGVVHEFPHRGRKVEPVIIDRLVDNVFPHFTHPFPLSKRYFLAAVKPTPSSLWGIYLVDVFDNMTLLYEEEGEAILEPIPVMKTVRPPVLIDRTVEGEKEATVFISDIYFGPGLKGIPRGTVKSMLVLSYDYAHFGIGGHNSIGIESGWDIKRVIGEIPVQPDGSASFKIPANTPIALQPLDADGAAVQLFRSWLMGRPGESISCSGCHEAPGNAPPARKTLASTQPPTSITPYYGDPRPFSFRLEIQPVLDRYCVGCHDGESENRPDFSKGEDITVPLKRQSTKMVSESYIALQQFVRRPGPEGDYHLLNPMEYHTNTSELFQMLDKGHHGVALSAEARRKLQTWANLNVPYRGRWNPPISKDGMDQHLRRIELAKLYANIDTDSIGEYEALKVKLDLAPRPKPIIPKSPHVKYKAVSLKGWPFTLESALEKQKAVSSASQNNLEIDLGGDAGVMRFVRIPAGEFVMGSLKGYPDEAPLAKTAIGKSFWMAEREVTNAQYACFNPKHDSRYIDMPGKDQKVIGFPANEPEQPVSRVSWREAMAFCDWLGEQSGGRSVTLPTEAQWEWACRAGTDSDFFYGSTSSDFTPFANLADSNISRFDKTIKSADKKRPVFIDAYIPRVEERNDKAFIMTAPGQYKANAWGLFDMHGNVAEWTRSAYAAYPYRDDGRNKTDATSERTVRGGSWRDRPKRATSSFRLPFKPYQKVANVGFRVIIETTDNLGVRLSKN